MNLSKETVIKIVKHPFFQGSAIAFVGSFGVNALSYLYNVVIGRMLGVVGYGEYLSLVSILYIASVPSNVLGTVVTKYTAIFSSHNENLKIKSMLIKMTQYSFIFSLAFILILTLFQNQIIAQLKLNQFLSLFLIGLIYTFSFPQTILNGAFTGLQKFVAASVYGAILVSVRIILAVLFILLGLYVNGILYSMILSAIMVVLLSWISISNSIDGTKFSVQQSLLQVGEFIKGIITFSPQATQGLMLNKELLTFAMFTAFNNWGLGSLVQTDIILAKAFLSPYDAGLYSSLAITCKVIPFFTQPLVIVMFPQIVQRVAQKKNFMPLFAAVLGVVTLGAGFVTAIYIFFPQLVITLLFGKKFLEAAPYIGIFSLAQMAYAILNVFSFFFLSIGKNKTASLVLIAAVIQAIGIQLFHSSLTQIIMVSIVVIGGCVALYAALTLQFYFKTQTQKV